MMKWKIFFVLLFILTIGIVGGYYLGTKNNSVNNNQTLKPTDTVCNALTIQSPTNGQKVTSPLTVSVIVDNTKSCKWAVFEAQAGVISLQDSMGRKIGSANLTTTEDWMTEKPVVYTGTIEFGQTPASSDLLLVITEEKTSGLGPEENGQSVTIPLTY